MCLNCFLYLSMCSFVVWFFVCDYAFGFFIVYMYSCCVCVFGSMYCLCLFSHWPFWFVFVSLYIWIYCWICLVSQFHFRLQVEAEQWLAPFWLPSDTRHIIAIGVLTCIRKKKRLSYGCAWKRLECGGTCNYSQMPRVSAPAVMTFLNHQNEPADPMSWKRVRPNTCQTMTAQLLSSPDASKNSSMSETAVWRTTQPLCCMSNPMTQLEARCLVAGLALRLAA